MAFMAMNELTQWHVRLFVAYFQITGLEPAEERDRYYAKVLYPRLIIVRTVLLRFLKVKDNERTTFLLRKLTRTDIEH